jgi:hypothetical protein
MYRADAFTPFNLNLSARTGSARACARDRQNRHTMYLIYILINIIFSTNKNPLFFINIISKALFIKELSLLEYIKYNLLSSF